VHPCSSPAVYAQLEAGTADHVHSITFPRFGNVAVEEIVADASLTAISACSYSDALHRAKPSTSNPFARSRQTWSPPLLPDLHAAGCLEAAIAGRVCAKAVITMPSGQAALTSPVVGQEWRERPLAWV